MLAPVVLTLLLGPVSSHQPPIMGSANPLTLTVAVHNDAAVPANWLRRAQQEMTRIYNEIGVQVVWLAAHSDASVGAQRSDTVTWPQHALIVLIRPNAGSPHPDLPQNAMGAAWGTADERGRVAYVFYDRTEPFTPLYRPRLLGHVIAHEIGHLLLPMKAHSPRGLMRAQWSRADLELALNGQLRFTPEQACLIRAKVSQPAERAVVPQCCGNTP